MKYFVYDFVRFTAWPGLLWYRPKKYYENENARKRFKGGGLLVSNHTSVLDPMYLMLTIWYRRHHYVCTDELLSNRFNKWLFKSFLCIPIDRDNFGVSSFKAITSTLMEGELVALFPEGHVVRSAEEKELEKNQQIVDNLKSGMVLMAFRSGVPIWPVYIKRRANIFQRLRVAIGEPIDVCGILGKYPTMDSINGVSLMIKEKERLLKSLVDQKEDRK